MKETLEDILMVGLGLVGLAVFAFVMAAIVRLHSRMWRRVAKRSGQSPNTGRQTRRFETIVIAERGTVMPFTLDSYRQYVGTWIDLHSDGLALSRVPPFNLACPPLFLSFDEMTLDRTDWALWPEPYAIRMTTLPGIDIILAKETVRWIRERTDRQPFGWGD